MMFRDVELQRLAEAPPAAPARTPGTAFMHLRAGMLVTSVRSVLRDRQAVPKASTAANEGPFNGERITVGRAAIVNL